MKIAACETRRASNIFLAFKQTGVISFNDHVVKASVRVARQKPNRCDSIGFRCREVCAEQENKKF